MTPTTRTGPPRQGAPSADIATGQGCSVASECATPSPWSAPTRRAPRWGHLWRTKVAEAHDVAQARRRRVLAHPDLAAALTRWPVGYDRAEDWRGYVPPREWGEVGADPVTTKDENGQTIVVGWRERPARTNESPYRVALVAISAEALRRDRASSGVS